MGSPKEEKGRSNIELSIPVKLTKGFFMAVYPGHSGAMADGDSLIELCQADGGIGHRHSEPFLGDEEVAGGSHFLGRLPVFPEEFAEMDKQLYRLPTEAEWEYACRAGDQDAVLFRQHDFHGAGQFRRRSRAGRKGTSVKSTTPVGSFPPNAWGLYDMHGNVAQWCQDRSALPGKKAVDPQGPEDGGSRVLRGGSWEDGPGRCRSACRAWDSPDHRSLGTVSFRVCFFVKE